MSTARHVVVVVGCSFAGLTAAKHLRRYARVIVVDPRSYFEYTPGVLHGMIGCGTHRLFYPLACALGNCDIIHGTLIAICPSSHYITVKLNNDEVVEVTYDAVLLACGVPYTHPIRSDTHHLTSRILELQECSSTVISSRDIIVIGGGLVGVELAAELAFCSREMGNCKVILLTRSHSLLCSLPPTAGVLAEKWLWKHGVDVVYGEGVERIVRSDSGYAVHTKSGREIYATLALDCTGRFLPSREGGNLHHTSVVIPLSGMRNNRGAIPVDKHLQPVSHPSMGVFVAGDIAEYPCYLEKGVGCVKNAFIAESHGELCAANILRHLHDPMEGMLKFPEDVIFSRSVPLVACVSLGSFCLVFSSPLMLMTLQTGPLCGVLVFNSIVVGGSGVVGRFVATVKYLIEVSIMAEVMEKLWAR